MYIWSLVDMAAYVHSLKEAPRVTTPKHILVVDGMKLNLLTWIKGLVWYIIYKALERVPISFSI